MHTLHTVKQDSISPSLVGKKGERDEGAERERDERYKDEKREKDERGEIKMRSEMKMRRKRKIKGETMQICRCGFYAGPNFF